MELLIKFKYENEIFKNTALFMIHKVTARSVYPLKHLSVLSPDCELCQRNYNETDTSPFVSFIDINKQTQSLHQYVKVALISFFKTFIPG